MGHSLCMQPWVNLGGVNQTITQQAHEWVDLAGYQDVAILVELADINFSVNAVTLAFETSPSPDEAFFAGIAAVASYTFSTTSGALGVQPIAFVRLADGVSLCRYLRWKVTFGATSTQMTFRVWLNLNQAGW